jgi:hypothetical protein
VTKHRSGARLVRLAQRIKNRWPKAKRPGGREAWIYFQDESGFSLLPPVRIATSKRTGWSRSVRRAPTLRSARLATSDSANQQARGRLVRRDTARWSN